MTTAQIHFQSGPQDYPPPDWNSYQIRATSAAAKAFPPAQADIKSILILKLDALGDHLLHTPFFAGLRQHYPHAKITLVCVPNTANLAETNPNFDHIVQADFAAGADQRQNFMFALELQSHAAAPFDLIILPRWSEDWHHAGVIAQTLDAPYRLSYSARSTPMKRQYALQHDDYFTHVIDDEIPAHEVWRGMQLLHALGMAMPPANEIKQEIYATAEDHTKIDALFNDKNYPRPWFAFGIGASMQQKRWPAEKFAELANALQQEYNGTIFIIGNGDEDQQTAATILTKSKDCVNVVGNISARQTGILIGRCDMIITNDSFALHAAATLQTPAVEIIGHPADINPDSEYLPRRFGPWGIPFACVQPLTCEGSQHLQSDYLNEPKCIADVSADTVFTALKEMIKRHGKIAS